MPFVYRRVAFVYIKCFEYIYWKLERMISNNVKDCTLALRKDIEALGDRMDQLFKAQLKSIVIVMQCFLLFILILKLVKLL